MTAEQKRVLPLDIARAEEPALSRLAALHEEAAETAHLANLLGRAPYIAALLGAGAATVGVLVAGGAGMAALVVWLLLVAAGVAGIGRAYLQAIEAPFERAPLKSFARDLRALLLYAGFAWGAGAFLALPGDVGAVALAVFSAGMAAALAALIRAPDGVLAFAAPAIAFAAFAAVLRPLPDGALAAGLVLIAGLVLGAAVLAAGRLAGRTGRVPALSELSRS